MAFLSEYPEATREPSLLDDTGNLLKSGAYDVGASMLELPASGLGLGLAAGLRDRWRQLAQQEFQKVNPTLQKQINDFGVEWNNGDPRFREGSTWQGALGAAVKSAPSMVPYMAGGLAGRAVAGTAGALIGYGGSNTLMMGGDAAHQARQEALQQGATHEDAERKAMEAYANVAPHAFASGALAGPMEEAILLKGGQGKIIPNMIQGGTTEGIQETYESGAQQRAVNQALGRDEWHGVGDAALTGLAIGALSGGGMSASSASMRKGVNLLRSTPEENQQAQAELQINPDPVSTETQATETPAAPQIVPTPAPNKVVTAKGPVDAIPLVGETVNPDASKKASLLRNPASVYGDGLEPVGREMPYTLDDLSQEGYVEGAMTPNPQFAAKASALKSKFRFGQENRMRTGSEIDQRIEAMNSPQQLEKFLASRKDKLARLDQVIEQLRVTGDESALQDALELRDLQAGENAYARGRLEDILQGRPVYNGFERMKGDVGPPDDVMFPQGRPEGNVVQNQTPIDVVTEGQPGQAWMQEPTRAQKLARLRRSEQEAMDAGFQADTLLKAYSRGEVDLTPDQVQSLKDYVGITTPPESQTTGEESLEDHMKRLTKMKLPPMGPTELPFIENMQPSPTAVDSDYQFGDSVAQQNADLIARDIARQQERAHIEQESGLPRTRPPVAQGTAEDGLTPVYPPLQKQLQRQTFDTERDTYVPPLPNPEAKYTDDGRLIIPPESNKRTLDRQSDLLRAARTPVIEDKKPGFNPEALLQPNSSGDLASPDFIRDRAQSSDEETDGVVADDYEGDLGLRHAQTNTTWISRLNNKQESRIDNERPEPGRAFDTHKTFVNRDVLKENEVSLYNPPQSMVDNLVEAVHFGDVSFRRTEDRTAEVAAKVKDTIVKKDGDTMPDISGKSLSTVIDTTRVADPSTGQPVMALRATSPQGVMAMAIPHPKGGYQIVRKEAVANPLGNQEKIDEGRIKESIKRAKRSAKQFDPSKQGNSDTTPVLYVVPKDRSSAAYPVDAFTLYKLGKSIAPEPMTDSEYFLHGLTELMDREKVVPTMAIPDNLVIKIVGSGDAQVHTTYGKAKAERSKHRSLLRSQNIDEQLRAALLQSEADELSARSADTLAKMREAHKNEDWKGVAENKKLFRQERAQIRTLRRGIDAANTRAKNAGITEDEYDPKFSRSGEGIDNTGAPKEEQQIRNEARETEMRNTLVKDAKQNKNWLNTQIDTPKDAKVSAEPLQKYEPRTTTRNTAKDVQDAKNEQIAVVKGTKFSAIDKSGRDLTPHYAKFVSDFVQNVLGLKTSVTLASTAGIRSLVSEEGEIQQRISMLTVQAFSNTKSGKKGDTEAVLRQLKKNIAALEAQKAFLRNMDWKDSPAKFISLKGATAQDDRLVIYLSDKFESESARFEALTHELGHYIQKAAVDKIINQALFDSYQGNNTDAIRTVKELFGFDASADLATLTEGQWQQGEEHFAEMLRAWFKSYNPASKNEALAKANSLAGTFFSSLGNRLYKLWQQVRAFYRAHVHREGTDTYRRNMTNFNAFIEAITDVTGTGQARSAKSRMYATVLGEAGQSYNPALRENTQQNFSPLRVMARSKQVAQYAATQGLDTLASLDPIWRPLDEQMKRMDSPLGNVLRKAFHIAPGDTTRLTAAEQAYADAVADLSDGTYYDQIKLYSAPFWNRLGKLVKDLPQKKNFWNRKDPQAGQSQARIAKALLAETPDNQLAQTLNQQEIDQVKEVRKYLKDIYDKLHQMGVAWQHRQNYFPHIQNHEELEKRQAEYVSILMQYEGLNNQEAMKRYREELARGQMLMLSQYDPSIDIRNSSFGFRPPRPFNLQTQRALRDANFYVDDIGAVLYNYTHMAFKFGVQAKMFGNYEVDPMTGATKFRINGRINDAINRGVLNGDLTIEQANWLRNKALPAYFGTLGAEMPSRLRAVQSTLMTGVNMALLGFSTLSSIPELGQIDVRSGRLGSSMKEAFKVLSNKQYRQQLQQVASAIGTIREDLVEHALTGALDNSWMIPSMQKVNHAYFKWIGQKHWTDFTRTVSLGLAQEALTEYAASNNQAALDELRISAAEINAWNQAGRPIPTDTSFAKIGHALNAWVDQAVIRPNPALRPIYGSNPYFALVWHLKDYMWGMYSVVWKRVWHMARVEPRKVAKALPFLLMGAALMPLAMLATELRRLITDEIPAEMTGTSPRRRKEGGEYWLDVMERSGIPAQFSVLMRAAQDAENNENVLTSLSPVADTFSNFLSKPASYSTSRMVPVLGSMPAFRKEVFGSPF